MHVHLHGSITGQIGACGRVLAVEDAWQRGRDMIGHAEHAVQCAGRSQRRSQLAHPPWTDAKIGKGDVTKFSG